MTERSVVLRLKAEIADFKRQMAEAKKATQSVGDATEDTAKRSNTALGQMVQSASKNEEAWTKVGGSLLGVGAAAAAGIGLAVSKYAEFDQAMSSVQAATHESAAAMAQLRAAAIEAGADTQYSATEAAQGVEELAKAGVSTADILGGGLAGALNLAAAGTIDVGDAAETTATALTIFKLKGDQASHVADLLAAGAGKAQGSVEDMAMALKQGGLVADQTGLSIEETAGGLAAFASAGLIGSDAGTSFKTMLQRLTPQSEEAQRAMDDLGISAYDSGGNFIGLAAFAGKLQDALKNLTPEQRNSAMATIFGSDAVRAASVLYDKGAAGIQEWIDKVDDSGYAAETARLKTDNLRGDIERLGGAFDTALIQTGSGADGVLRGLTQRLTDVVDGYGELNPQVQNATLLMGAAVAAVGLLGGGFLVLAPRIIATQAALATLKADMPKTSAAMGVLGKAAGIAGAAYGIIQLTNAVVNLADGSRGAVQDIEAVKSIVLELDGVKVSNLFAVGKGIDDVNDALDALTGSGLKQKLNRQAATLDGVFGTSIVKEVDNSREAFKSYDQALASLVQAGHAEEAAAGLKTLYAQVDQSKYSIDDLKALLPGYAEALTGVANEQKLAGESAVGMAGAVAQVDPAMQEASDAVAKWRDAVAEADGSFIDLQGAYQGVIDKNSEVAQSAADATETSKDSWKDFYDGVSVSVSDYIAQLQAQVDAQAAWETNITDISGRVRDTMSGDMRTAAEQMIDELIQLGPEGAAQVQLLHDMTDDELRKVVDLWSQKGTQAVSEFVNKVESYRQPTLDLLVDSVGAQNAINGFITSNTGRRINVSVDAVGGTGVNYQVQGSSVKFFAGGGSVNGPGTATSDSIPALLSNGEYVVKASAVQQYGRPYFDNLNAQRYASGGPVGSMPAGPMGSFPDGLEIVRNPRSR